MVILKKYFWTFGRNGCSGIFINNWEKTMAFVRKSSKLFLLFASGFFISIGASGMTCEDFLTNTEFDSSENYPNSIAKNLMTTGEIIFGYGYVHNNTFRPILKVLRPDIRDYGSKDNDPFVSVDTVEGRLKVILQWTWSDLKSDRQVYRTEVLRQQDVENLSILSMTKITFTHDSFSNYKKARKTVIEAVKDDSSVVVFRINIKNTYDNSSLLILNPTIEFDQNLRGSLLGFNVNPSGDTLAVYSLLNGKILMYNVSLAELISSEKVFEKQMHFVGPAQELTLDEAIKIGLILE